MAIPSLRVRMLLLVLLAVVPALALILYDGFEGRRLEGERAQEQAQFLVQRLSRDQEQAVMESRQLLVTLAQLPAVRELDGQACSRLLRDIWRQHRRYANIGAIRADGDVFCSATPSERMPSARDSTWFRRAVESRNFAISDFHFGGITGRAVQTMAYPVVDHRGTVVAVVFVSLDLAWLNRFIAETSLPAGSVLGLIDRRGTVLARHPDPEFWVGENMAETPLAREILAQQRPGLTRSSGMDRQARLYAYTPLSGSASRSAFLYVGIPEKVAYAGPERALQRNLIGLGVAALLALAAAWWGGAFLLRRMQPLLDATRRLAAGNLGARSGIAHRQDEIGQVAQAFDRMAEALQLRDRALHDSRAELEKAQEVAHVGSWVWTPGDAGKLTWSKETYRIFGLAEERFDNRVETFYAMAHADDLAAVKEAVRAALAGETPYSIEHRILRPDGSVRWVHQQADVVRDAAGQPVSMVGVVRDITERKRSEERIQYLAYYDALTGLANRALFQDRLQQAMIDADRNERLVGLIFLDLDRFKDINDTLGHDQGDRLLGAVAERLSGVVRKSDTVARFGGDEFTIVLADMAHVEDAARVAQKILEVFARPFHVHNRELHVTASLGITLYPFDDRSVQELLRNADIAMYRAKELGRNTYQFYAAEMTARARERLALEGELRHAIERRELVLHYQPVVEMSAGTILGMEALVRWQHPVRGLMPPDQFIPLAEETGQILAIGEWVLRTACRQCALWQRQGFPQLRLAVNLSARQFRQRPLVELIRQMLAECELSPSALDLEITESALLQQDETTVAMLNAFRQMGVSLIVDDFGIGYSSLSYLRRFPIRALKIDRSFVHDIPDDPDDAAIVGAVVTMAHSLGLVVIAEGVETPAQRDFLRAHGCSIGQGYLYSRPVPAGSFSALLPHRLPAAGGMDIGG